MTAPRRFDHDEARSLRAEGWTYVRIADHFGVTDGAVHLVCNPDARLRSQARVRESFRSTCEDCGGTCWHNPYSRHTRLDRVVCRDCADERRREEELLKRLDADGLIRCAAHVGCDVYEGALRVAARSQDGAPPPTRLHPRVSLPRLRLVALVEVVGDGVRAALRGGRMNTAWRDPVPHTQRCAKCESWPPDPGLRVCAECKDEAEAELLGRRLEAAKHAAKHAEKGTR